MNLYSAIKYIPTLLSTAEIISIAVTHYINGLYKTQILKESLFLCMTMITIGTSVLNNPNISLRSLETVLILDLYIIYYILPRKNYMKLKRPVLLFLLSATENSICW